MLTKIALLICFFMALYLFSFSYIEGLKIGNRGERFEAGTFLFFTGMAFVFSGLTYLFI
ncbi:hypothetical protein [Falsibacillus pallidus]|uniref:Uncharacterized protein n=1 Tax=Falsibacillus pallidus TaxID=493781 RepID=A0A370G174_9BACI|nr:hypothetical protein [Falsibacillus pallidus]RDI36649.1 hypothetical protein DFR59_1272 [Falsibacillus pallidus]